MMIRTGEALCRQCSGKGPNQQKSSVCCTEHMRMHQATLSVQRTECHMTAHLNIAKARAGQQQRILAMTTSRNSRMWAS